MLRFLIAAAFALSFNVTALAQSNSKKIADHIASSAHDGSFLGVVDTFADLPLTARENDFAETLTTTINGIGIEARAGFWRYEAGSWLPFNEHSGGATTPTLNETGVLFYIADAFNVGGQPAGNGLMKLDSAVQIHGIDTIATYDTATGVLSINAPDDRRLKATAYFETFSSPNTGNADRAYYFRDVTTATNIPNGQVGTFGQGSLQTPAVTFIERNVSINLDVRSASSGNNQHVNEGSFIRVEFAEDEVIPTAIVDGQTGYYRLGIDKPATPIALSLNANARTTISTGFDFTQADDMTLKLFTVDTNLNAEGVGNHYWQSLEIDVDALVARGNTGGTTIDTSVLFFDNDYFQINVTDATNGDITILPIGRAMSYVKSELWIAAPDVTPSGETLVSGTSSATVNQTPLTDTYATYETVTLPKAGTYRVYGKLSSWANTPSNDTGGGARVQLVDATNTAVLDASYSWIVAGEPTANRDTQLIASQTVEAEITVTSPTVITLDAEYVSATQSTIYNNDEARTYLSYRQLPEKTVVTLPNPSNLEVQNFGGQFLLDPNEFNAFGILGPFDNTNTQDIGNVGGDPIRTAGGFSFPFDVQVKELTAWHYNSNAAALPWGWRVFAQTKVEDSTARTNIDLGRECVGDGVIAVCPNDFQDNANHTTTVDLSASPVVPAGTVIGIGVEAPTALDAQNYVYVMSGFLSYERVE